VDFVSSPFLHIAVCCAMVHLLSSAAPERVSHLGDGILAGGLDRQDAADRAALSAQDEAFSH
jgi:hypothetical protein